MVFFALACLAKLVSHCNPLLPLFAWHRQPLLLDNVVTVVRAFCFTPPAVWNSFL